MCTLLMNKAERDDYWLRFWEETAQAEHPAKANGRSSASAAEFFYLLADICAKLEFSGESSLLDIGCGSGHVLQMLAPWVRYAVGVDYAQGQVKNAARHLLKFPHVEVRQANVLALPFPEGTFDRVLCWSVLQYLPDREQVQTALREVARVLAPGGRALVAGNPDIQHKADYLSGIARLDRTPEQKALLRARNERLLWLAPEEMADLAGRAGMAAEIRTMDPHIWQSWYMYDLVLARC
ncbi:MAG TPA: methyltransferase domain-containing protein [Chthonomonadaceae bacterium]|nr:methyltransferase domain-containing protein [Chthonomonadaceae bacterium]